MRYELKLHRITFGILTLLLIIFLFFLLHVHPGLDDERLETIVSLAVVVVTAAIFVTIGIIETTIAFQFGKQHRRELLSYLILGLFSLACGLYLAISNTASIQTVALVTAPHALLFGLGEIRLAKHLERHPTYKKQLTLNGFVEIALGIALFFGYKMSNHGAATLLAYAAILSILQLLPLLFHWPQKSIPAVNRH